MLVTGAGIMLRLIQVLGDSEMPLSSRWAGAGLIANMRRIETIVKVPLIRDLKLFKLLAVINLRLETMSSNY